MVGSVRDSDRGGVLDICAVVLAGGKSSRMGSDKALLPFGGYDTLVEYQYRKLEAIFDKVYISCKENKFSFEANIIQDKYLEHNPLNAIISAFEELKCSAIFFISVDVPLVSLKSISKLIELYNLEPKYDIYALKSCNKIEPMIAIYSKKIVKKAKEHYALKDFKLLNIIKESKYITLDIKSIVETLNLNKQSEYQEALKYIKKS